MGTFVQVIISIFSSLFRCCTGILGSFQQAEGVRVECTEECPGPADRGSRQIEMLPLQSGLPGDAILRQPQGNGRKEESREEVEKHS